MTHSDVIETMWFDVFGNSTLGCIAILAVFFFLCYKRKLNIGESVLVIFPVLFGMILIGYLPWWVKGLFVIPIGFLWGLAVLKIAGLR